MEKSQQKAVDVLCAGHASYDLVFAVPENLLPDDKSVATAFVRCGGGPAANAAVAVARLGYRAAFAGYLGRDIFGDLHLAELEGEGVLIEQVARGDPQTPASAVMVKPDGTRSLVNYRAELEPLRRGSIDFSTSQPKVILFDGHEPLIALDLLDQFEGRGIKFILDAGSLHPGTELLYNRVDYLVCSEKFAIQFTGEHDPHRALDILSGHAPVIVITLGDRGCVWRGAEGIGNQPAYSVKAIDTTGAGDAFHGAFAACIAAGKDLAYTMRNASAVAALSCTKLGARPSMPTKREVDQFLRAVEKKR